MSKVLVIGDLIIDVYHNCKATRLCPEAPVPVLTPIEQPKETWGGAGLVVRQLTALMGGKNTSIVFGTTSFKHRYFVDNHLSIRIDDDAKISSSDIIEKVKREVAILGPDLIIISDYGKGSVSNIETAHNILKLAKDIPVFIDAKHNWNWYMGTFAAFPNQQEYAPSYDFQHVIQKLGPQGCSVDGQIVPVDKHEVLDVTGAGDIFLAAFAAMFLKGEGLFTCAQFANKVAARSVEFVGTHVVTEFKP